MKPETEPPRGRGADHSVGATTIKTLAQHVTAPRPDYIARSAASKVISPHQARRVRALKLAVVRAERALDAPYFDVASLRIDWAVLALENAIAEVAEAED